MNTYKSVEEKRGEVKEQLITDGEAPNRADQIVNAIPMTLIEQMIGWNIEGYSDNLEGISAFLELKEKRSAEMTTYISPVYISVVETARLIRKELKAKFPGTKFSVRSETYSGGASINVRYNGAGGGPIGEDVDAVAKFFQGGGFDGMIDMAYSKYHYMLPDGTFIEGRSSGTEGSMGSVPGWHNEMPEGAVKVRFGADFIFVTDEGPRRHRENCEWFEMPWCPGGGCHRGLPRRKEDVLYDIAYYGAVPFHSESGWEKV